MMITKDNLKHLIRHGHVYLNHYKTIEVIIIFTCLYLIGSMANDYDRNVGRYKEWDVAFYVPYCAALFGMIKECIASIRDKGK